MILACDRGDSIELRAATSAAQLGQPGRWLALTMPISFVNKIGLAALERANRSGSLQLMATPFPVSPNSAAVPDKTPPVKNHRQATRDRYRRL
jgi:hypothetical protein